MMSESSSQNSHDVVAKLHEMRYILIHKYFIAMRASSTTFLSFFMPCYCTLPYFFLWEEQQEGKWKICRRRSVFLSSCVHANWSRMRLNPIRFSPSLKWKSFFYCLVLREKKELQITKKKCWTDFNMNMHIEVDQTLTNCIGDKIIHSSWILLSFFDFYKMF